MKIILDLRKYDGVVGGVEQGAIQLARNITSAGGEVLLICKGSRESALAGIMGEVGGLRIVPAPVEKHSMCSENVKIDSGFLQDLAVREKADLIHFFYNWSFPYNKKVPSILTVHDVIPFTFREAMGFFKNRFTYRPRMKEACRLNDLVATVSEYSRQDIHKKVGVPLDKIHVVHNGLREPAGPDPRISTELRDRFGLADGFILNAGGIHERKNIPRLIRAFAGLVEAQGYPGRLVITGKASGAPYQDRMRKICDTAVDAAGMDDRVIFTGFVTEKELDLLMRMAEVFVYPSLYEGFGIPVLEAMKVDTPVVTSNCTAMPEVAGDAAVLVDPCDAEAMTAGLARLLNDQSLREQLIEKGRKRAEGYTWQRNCAEYMELYDKVISGS